MPSINDVATPPRRELTVFYILDTSGSMSGQSISMLNRAMEETVDSLKEVAKDTADAQLKIAVLEFSSGCRWVQPNGPENMEDFVWVDLTAGGLTDVGEALKELNSKMSRSSYLQSMTGAFLPIVVFMSDGNPTDDYKKELEKIRQNKWFKRATKIGLAIGDDADVDMIADVVGNCEAVVQPNDLSTFARLIKFASVTASVLNSQSQPVGTDTSGAGIIRSAAQEGVITEGEIVSDAGTMDPQPADVAVDDFGDDDWV